MIKKDSIIFVIFKKKTIDMMEFTNNSKFLDIGCGTGFAVLYVNQRYEEVKSYGIDISPKMISKAQQKSKSSQIFFKVAMGEELPFENIFFDFILCTNSLHHYLSPTKALKEIYRVLTFSSKVYILDLSSDNPIMKFVNKKLKKKEKEHVSFYTTQEMKDFFNNAYLKYLNTKNFRLSPLKLHIGQKEADLIHKIRG